MGSMCRLALHKNGLISVINLQTVFPFFCLGHLKRFGEHRPSEGEISSLKYAPSSADFYHNYIHKRRPAVIRNGASHWPAVQLWQNESYLTSNFGSSIFTVEYRKKFKNEHPVRKPLSFEEFLKIYKSEDVYLDSSFPPNSLMLNDIILPSVLNCHEISSSIDSLNLLVNSGDANSAFHHDGFENILTVISGTKTVYLINSTYSKELYADQFSIVAGVLSIDPEKLDLETYPKLAVVPYYEVTLNKGEYFSKQSTLQKHVLNNYYVTCIVLEPIARFFETHTHI